MSKSEDYKFHSPAELQTLNRVGVADPSRTSAVEYRLYKQRWAGLLAICLLDVVGSAGLGWFSPIAIPTSELFEISIDRVNWLNNCNNVMFLPLSLIVPIVCSRYGLRVPCLVGTITMFISAWVRYAGTTPSLSPDGKFALLLLAQILLSISQPWFLVLGPKYSEVWFNLKGRTTATMLITLSNPIGSALGQVVAPFCATVRESALVLAIATSVIMPTVLLIQPAPPIPPTYAGSRPSPPPIQILRALLGCARPGEAFMTFRERLDSVILILCFGSLGGGFTTLNILLSQIIAPYGYDSGNAGIMGGVSILAGIIGAAVASPIFDRYLTHHLALAAKLLVPILVAAFISLIWVVRESNIAGIYIVLVVLGIGSITLLPVSLEMGCEVTRSPEVSSSALWFAGNLLTVVFVTSMSHLRDDSPTANPPSNMRRSLIFQAIFVAACACSILGLQGKQARRELDEQKQQEGVYSHQDVGA